MTADELVDHLFAVHADQPLGSLFPALLAVEDEPVPVHDLDVRSRNCLARAGLSERWGAILAFSIVDLLDLRNFGVLSAARTLTMIARRAAAVLERATAPSETVDVESRTPQAPSWLDGALAELATWAFLERGAGTLGELLDALNDRQALPDDLLPTVGHLRAAELSALPVAPRVPDISALLEPVLAGLDQRERLILLERVTEIGRVPTLDDLGCTLGLTRERVRQLEARLLEGLTQRLQYPEHGPLRWVLRRVQRSLGLAIPTAGWWDRTGIEEALSEDQRRLLLWLAGPYKEQDGWLVKAGSDVQARTVHLVSEQLASGPVPVAEVRAAVASLGVRLELAMAWLSRQRVREQSGLVMRWQGSLNDKAVTVLALHGQPMDRVSLNEAIGEGHSLSSLINAIALDARILRVAKDSYGLAVWGGERYRTVVGAITDELLGRGGEAAIADLVAVLPARFNIAATSVPAYADSHQFVNERPGVIRLRRPDDVPPAERSRLPHLTKNCYRADGGWSTRILVTREQLRGSGSVVGEAFARAVGVSGRTSPVVSRNHGQHDHLPHRAAADAQLRPVGPGALRRAGGRPSVP